MTILSESGPALSAERNKASLARWLAHQPMSECALMEE